MDKDPARMREGVPDHTEVREDSAPTYLIAANPCVGAGQLRIGMQAGRAIDLLVQDGLVQTVPGRGTFVTR